MSKKTETFLLSWVCLSGLVQCAGAIVFWTATVEISYSQNNRTMERSCECGIYGRSSPLSAASGVVTLPTSDIQGCGSHPVYSPKKTLGPWIALVKRGNCTFSEKINAAKHQGADGVVVYNLDGTGNSTSHMAHSDAKGIVAIMIGNSQGIDIANLVRNGVTVNMVITVGNPHGPWMDTYWLYFLSIAFFIVTAASIAYFVFVSASRLHILRTTRREQREMKSKAKKAIGQLKVRTLKRDDEETGSDSHTCAVCIDSYKPGDVVTVLTCGHFFHKTCIEPWLLEKRTCPMCKCDILKSLGVEEEEERRSSISPPDVTVVTVSGSEPLYEVNLTDPMTSYPERGVARDQRRNHFDNHAFEGDSQATKG